MKCQITILSVLGFLVRAILADTNYTACDPTKSPSCPPDPGFSSSRTFVNFEQPYPDGLVTLFSANSITRDKDGLHLTINSIGEEPFVVTDDYIFYGRVTATMKTTNASVIGTFFNLQADDLDEMDFQWSGNENVAHAIYYSRAILHNVTEPNEFNVSSPHTTFHNYTFDWTSERIEWIIDGVTVASLTNASAGASYPQAPVRVSIGIYCPGCYGNASVQVGSSLTENLDDYVATVTSLEVENYNPASQYTFRDMSGSANSVVLTLPTSTSKLTGGVIAGIVVGGLAVVIIFIGVVAYFCRRNWSGKKDQVEYGEAQEIPGARTKFTQGQSGKVIVPIEETVTRALRYPEEGEVGGRLGQLSFHSDGMGPGT